MAGMWHVLYGENSKSHALNTREQAVSLAWEQMYRPGDNVTGVEGPNGEKIDLEQIKKECAGRPR